MKTEIERVCEIMETLLAHQPIIDVPYEKINDIAVALVKEGYGDISEYKAEIERLKAKIKQAQLGVLGKLWSNISNSKQLIQSHIADGSFTIEDIYMEIDELMAEVQNEICDKFQCSAIDRSYMAKSCRQCEDIIEALHEAGYGDISEYKAEIERLKEAVEKLTEMLNKTNEPKTNVIKIDEAVVERYENQIKQAQIELMRLSLPKSRHLWRKKGNKNNL